jgi:hypothetical protein
MEFTIEADGVEILDTTFRSLAVAESFFRDDVIDLGSNFGPDIDLTFGYTLVADGSGGFGFDFAVGGAVPETSTWAMMLIGFAGLGYAGYRRTSDPSRLKKGGPKAAPSPSTDSTILRRAPWPRITVACSTDYPSPLVRAALTSDNISWEPRRARRRPRIVGIVR